MINPHLTEHDIAIVLSTYNGADYIAQQLDAILAQTYPYWRCYIRDDGSKDDTVSILRQYSAKDARIIFLDDQKGNMGLNPSHYYLLGIPQEEYIATCDQDDVWQTNKLAVSIKKLKAIETAAKIPALVHTDSVFVDSQLNVMRNAFIGQRGLRLGLSGILFANSVQGGSIMINKHLNQIALKTPPKLPYDYHLGIIADLVGVRAFIPETLLLYRQHSKSSIATGSQSNPSASKPSTLSATLALSLSGYHHIKHDFASITPHQKAKQELADYFYLYEGKSSLKKLSIAIWHFYPFYQKRDFFHFVGLILKNKNLLTLI